MTTFFLHEAIHRDLARAADRLVTICGAGALGANLAETLARMGLSRLRLIDRDRVAAHNLSTQPWAQQDIGAPKVRVLANVLYRAVGAHLDAQHVELTEANVDGLLAGSALVIDAFDNIASRALVAQAAAKLGIPCLHLALAGDGRYGCGLWDAGYLLPTETSGDDGCDYPLTRPLALLVAAAGAEAALRQLLGNDQHGFEVTLDDLHLLPAAPHSTSRISQQG